MTNPARTPPSVPVSERAEVSLLTAKLSGLPWVHISVFRSLFSWSILLHNNIYLFQYLIIPFPSWQSKKNRSKFGSGCLFSMVQVKRIPAGFVLAPWHRSQIQEQQQLGWQGQVPASYLLQEKEKGGSGGATFCVSHCSEQMDWSTRSPCMNDFGLCFHPAESS